MTEIRIEVVTLGTVLTQEVLRVWVCLPEAFSALRIIFHARHIRDSYSISSRGGHPRVT